MCKKNLCLLKDTTFSQPHAFLQEQQGILFRASQHQPNHFDQNYLSFVANWSNANMRALFKGATEGSLLEVEPFPKKTYVDKYANKQMEL